ncbi:hypothetical protein A0J61_10513 [Choanephora cucurbitarum]|uniref:MULE transposase domain-containing protein n=1 Tax=Choanephora cucurbitarum TaxID=101091 RepID=A0A1C7MXE4_9FUNG|nr:hypothetical protein A0J61_10513 [Choanephora cucurbitarum]
MMYEYITGSVEKDYQVFYTVDNDQRINAVFFAPKTGIEEARRMPENLVIDSTYKINTHKPTFVNIVGTSSVRSTKPGTLMTFEVAGAFISEEGNTQYEWVLSCLKKAIWSHADGPLTVTTYNEQALRNAIATVFPSAHDILCYVHMQKRFEAKLMECIAEKDKDRRDAIRQEIKMRFQAIALKAITRKEIKIAVQRLKDFFLNQLDIFRKRQGKQF